MNESEKYLIEKYNFRESNNRGKKVLILCIVYSLVLMIIIILNSRRYWWIVLYICLSFIIIELIMYVSTNLTYYDMTHKDVIYGTIIDSNELSKYIYVPESDEYKDKIQSGYDIASTKRLLILCLARDVEYNVEMSRNKLESIGKDFLEYNIVLFENDSDDDSRLLLQRWMDDNDNVELMDCCDLGSCDCLLNNAKGYDIGTIASGRIDKMRYYRELLLRYATEKYSNYDYVMIYDFDISGVVYKDGLMTSFSNEKDWDMVFASGLTSMPKLISNKLLLYDGIPYLPDNIEYDNMLSLKNLANMQNKLMENKVGDNLVKCKSGFNGMAIYRMECMLNSSYVNDTNRYCEHNDLHNDMYNKGYDQVYYNPSMVLFIGQGGPDKTAVFKPSEIRNYVTPCSELN
jgi:hypothetical protein